MSNCLSCGRIRGRGHLFCPGCGARFDTDAALVDNSFGMARANGLGRKVSADGSLPRPGVAFTELKQVTVLFADLVGSSNFVSAADPEEARNYLDSALHSMAEAIEAFGGTVSQMLGDGLLALFGAPLALEDHALRACLAAIEMQQRSRVAVSTASAAQIPPTVLRIGIHSGEAVVGISSEYLSSYYRAVGPTIHLASRLEQMALPGTVLISGATQRLAGDQVETISFGVREIRGFDQSVELYELSLSSHRSAASPLTRRQQWAPLVGRQDALASLAMLAGQARAGRMSVVGVRGEAGIGKSRLISEFCNDSSVAGFVIQMITARGYMSRSTYSVAADLMRELIQVPLELDRLSARQFLRDFFARWPDQTRAHLAAANDLLDLDAPAAEWLSATPSQRRRRITDALLWLIMQRLQAGPMLLIIEDVFLADRDSLRLFESLVRRLESKPVLVCLSYRQDFAHRWGEVPWFIEQWLGPLCAQHMSTLVTAVLGAHESLAGVIDELVERADGNPFYLEQMAITLVDDGSLVGAPGAYRLAKPRAELRVPASISAVIAARVDRLPVAAKASLEAAAIMDGPIQPELVAAMQLIGPEQADAHLQLGRAAGLLTAPLDEPQVSSYAFRHALVQEVLVAALTRARRKSLHRSAFETLQQRAGAKLDDAVAALSHHAFAGEMWPQAAAFSVKSMSRAIGRSANREALRVYELGLDATRRIGDDSKALPLELALRIEAIGALMPLGQIETIISNLERTESIARAIGDQRRLGGVTMQLSVLCWMRGRYAQGLIHADSAMAAGVQLQRRNLQMSAAQARMMMFHGLGRYRDAVEQARRIERDYAAEVASDQPMMGWAVLPSFNVRAFLASSLWRLDEVDAAQAICDTAYLALANLHHPYSRAMIDFVQGQIWTERGLLPQAVQLLQASVRSCQANDLPTMYPVMVGLLGGALALNGQAQPAVELLDKALHDRTYAAAGSYAEFLLRHNLAIALMHCGRYGEAVDSAQRAVDFAAKDNQHGHKADAMFWYAETLVAAGRPEQALLRFEEALAAAHECSMRYLIKQAQARMAQVSAGMRWTTKGASLGGS